MTPRVVTNIVDFNGGLFEVVRIDYENSIVALRKIVAEGEPPADVINVRVTDYTIRLQGEMIR